MKAPTNNQRAAKAKRALKDYEDEPAMAIQDLITDLLHLADKEGLNPQKLLQNAQQHHTTEQQEEGTKQR